MTMAESGDLGPNERWANGVMNDLRDEKEYGLCGFIAVTILAVTVFLVWLVITG